MDKLTDNISMMDIVDKINSLVEATNVDSSKMTITPWDEININYNVDS